MFEYFIVFERSNKPRAAAGLREVAQACGVSTSTVSDILNRGREARYRPETRERVLRVIQQMGYQPNRTAQSMRSRRTRVVGFVALNLAPEGRLENAGAYPFLIGLSHGLTPYGYHAALVELNEMEADAAADAADATDATAADATDADAQNGLPPVLRERFFDALVIQYGLSEAAVQLAARVAVPVLRWDSTTFEPENCLRRDERAVAREALARLWALGHRRIGYLVGGLRWERYQAGMNIDHYSYADRYETYCHFMRERDQKPILLSGYKPHVLGPQFVQARPTAVIAPESDGARAAIDAAQVLGWRVPEAFSVATLEHETRLREVGRQIGGMDYDRYATGQQAASMLREILDGSGAAPSHSDLFGAWQKGETIGPAAVPAATPNV